MKIACLIKASAPTTYFVNEIHHHHPVSLVVVESPSVPTKSRTQRLQEMLQSYGVLFTIAYLLESAKGPDPDVAHRHYFGERYRELDATIPVVTVDDINSPECIERLAQEKIDLIVDHGTSIVRAPVLDTAPLALNLHWGLSPYYRGTNCTQWALVNWDPYNIGVTIHKLAKRIDGGDILAQARAEIEPVDDAYRINMQLTHLGTKLCLQAIQRLEAGETLHFHPQDISAGFLTLSRQTSHFWARHARWTTKNKLAQMLKSPARRERLPIVEFGE